VAVAQGLDKWKMMKGGQFMTNYKVTQREAIGKDFRNMSIQEA